MAGGDPGFWHGPWPYLPGYAGEDHCRRQVPLYVLSHHHCAFTNKKKSDPRRMFVGPTGIRSCYPRASTVLHARALSCWPRTLTRSGLRHLSESSAMLPIFTSQTLARLYPLYVLCEISKPLSGCGGKIGPDSHAVRVTGDFKAAPGLTTARNGLSAFGGFARLRLTHLSLSGESPTIHQHGRQLARGD